MEILQYSIKKVNHTEFSIFQKKAWNILRPLLDNLFFEQLSDESVIEKSLGIDIFLKLKTNGFMLYISLTEESIYFNSKYFDIYIYPEVRLQKMRALIQDVFLGKYLINLGYGSGNKLIFKELIFDKKELASFNEKQKFGFFRRKIKYEKSIKGIPFGLVCKRSC